MATPIIPITRPEEVTTDKGEGKAKETIEQILKGIIGEGGIEGREEEILEEISKEEKRREGEKKGKVIRTKKERETIHIGKLVPGLVTAEKEHIHEKSIVPIKNGCCTKLCKDLNDEIFVQEESLGLTIPVSVGKGGKIVYKELHAIPYAVEALKDYRYLLDKKDVCKCYEETKEIEAPLPIIEEKSGRLISARTGKPITLGPDISKYEASKTWIHRPHREDRPTVPTHNGCCAKACDILTKQVSGMENRLDKMELRGGGPSFLTQISHNPRYGALAYKTSTLQEYRSKLTKKGICECLKETK